MANFTVSTTQDSGAGSLRAAIIAANADNSGTPTTIHFAVSGTITLASDLPAFSHSVAVDGMASGGAPVVAIDCNGHAGLVFAAGSQGSSLLGLAIGNASGNGITLQAGSITLNGNHIGLDLQGNALGNAGDGIYVAATSSGNQIGVNPATDGAAAELVTNVIAANGGNGISLHGSSQNSIVSNRIGTDPSGTVAMGNGANGIWLTDGAQGNEIGGQAYIDSATGVANNPTGSEHRTSPSFVVPPQGNLISGNAQNGVLIDANSQGNELNGNFIGTDASGHAALGNSQDGVLISGADGNALIGCDFTQDPFVYYNVVSGNGANGLEVLNSNNTAVQANFFGIGADNSSIVGNTLDGILVDGSSANTQVGGVIPLGNVSAGNGTNGIEVKDTASGFESFNTFAGLVAFSGAAANGNDGILVTATGGNQNIQTTVTSGNLNNGIEIGGNASGVTVDPVISGMNTDGTAILPNCGDGLLIDGTAHDNIIGGQQLSLMPRTAFSGNGRYGIEITGQAYDNQVVNTYVGTDIEGAAAIANGLGGILVGQSAHDNTIGGALSTPDRPNTVLVSGNTGSGITLDPGTATSSIINDVIGYSADGNLLLNGAPQIVAGGSNNTISGNAVACFASGTRIRTERGEVPVERLAVGDRVYSAIGECFRRVVWIGHRTIDCTRHPEPAKIWPVRVAANAFGFGMPARPLFLSPDHAVYVDAVLIPVKHLVNSDTIVQVETARVTYYHVELEQHDVLLAEGLPAESYLDSDNRNNFANGDGPVRLVADFARDETLAWEASCAPLVVTGPVLDAVRRRLAVQRKPIESQGTAATRMTASRSAPR